VITKPTYAMAVALLRLRNLSEMEGALQYLRGELDETQKRLVKVSEDAHFRCLQGRAQVLQELLDEVADAPNLVAKLGA
jgi:hypothetical protein